MQHAAPLISQSAVCPAALRSLFLFEALSHDQLLRLAADSSLVHYDTGVLFREGEPARYFYVLVDGEAISSKRAGGYRRAGRPPTNEETT